METYEIGLINSYGSITEPDEILVVASSFEEAELKAAKYIYKGEKIKSIRRFNQIN